MSLRRALEELPNDKVVESVAREILSLFQRQEGVWLSYSDVATRVSDSHPVAIVLKILVDSFVLDFHDEPASYMYRRDPLVDLEVSRYMRRAAHDDRRVQTNVAKYRRRYGAM